MKYLAVIIVILLNTCNANSARKLREGDILFRETRNNALSDAISDVTDSTGDLRFSHVGVLIKEGKRWMVVEATHGKGVCLTPIELFGLPAKGETVRVVLGRLDKRYKFDVKRLKAYGRQQLNKPYDYAFDWNDSAMYCSELVYKMFVAAGQRDAFSPNVMTFKNASTGAFDPTWVEYFDRHGSTIPEGELGINPNAMAASKAVHLLFEIRY